MRDCLPEIVSIIAIILLCAAFVFGIQKSLTQHDKKLWNDGYCNVCGGVLKYEQAIGHRSSTSYIYVCENCGKRIEVFELHDERK